MGETVEFKSNGDTASGYLAVPSQTPARGILVLQEWWGLDPAIKDITDRLATEQGFVALAPDLYRGELAGHTEMDKAGELMNSLPPDRAGRDMGGAVDYLLAHDAVTGDKVGVIGFCMGGMLTLVISAMQGDKIGAAVPFYGAPLGEMEPDWSNLTAPVLGHFAENDDFFPPGPVRELESKLKGMGKDVTFHVYPNTGHAFAGEHDALGTYDEDAAKEAWDHSLRFLNEKLS